MTVRQMTWAGALLIAVISVALGWLFARQGLEGVSWAAGIIGTLVTIITAVLGGDSPPTITSCVPGQ